ncbi:MAG: trypsin-like peptidase domain-containing protein [Planctomycetaceae bacterium]
MRYRIISPWLCSAVCWCLWAGATAAGSEARSTPQVRAVERVRTSVVNIHTERLSRERDTGYEGAAGRKVNGMGTGIIIDERGYIVTNQHVIADTTSRRVTLWDGSTYAAEVISYDIKHDLAIIKIAPSRPLTVIPLGTSSDLRLGETVLAVGNPFGYEHSVTQGIISSLSRDVEVNETQAYKNLLQTDASINPGNSGGPLLNLDGEIVGINVAIRANAQRIGFAIPIDDARRYIAKLLNINRLSDTYHGLVTHDVKTADQRKLVVDAFEPNSPAAVAGFQAGDVVTQVAAVPVNDQADLERAFLGHSAGIPIDVAIQRRHEPVKLTMQLAAVAGAPIRQAPPAIRPVKVEDTMNNRSWKVLGLRLDKANPVTLERFRDKYRGGMQVLDVRPGSPATESGVRKGDVLVGLSEWETTRHEDVQWVLNQSKLVAGPEPLKFYIIRDQSVRMGGLRLTQPAK